MVQSKPRIEQSNVESKFCIVRKVKGKYLSTPTQSMDAAVAGTAVAGTLICQHKNIDTMGKGIHEGGV